MKLTIDFISESFNKFNKEYFNNELRTPKFEIMSTKSLLGQFCYRYGDYKIRISNYFDRGIKDYQNTIIHEMIHEYIRQNNIKDTNRHHGRIFYSIADRINAQGGWHISRTDNVDGIGVSNSCGETYKVVILKLKDCYFKMVINPNYLNSFLARFNKHTDFYLDYVLFTSKNDKEYCSYSKCRKSIRGRYTTKEEFEKMKLLLKKVA